MLLRLHEVMIIKADDLLYYDAEMELMNMILLSIPNEIYNSMDSCKTAKQMWDRVERLMRGTIQNQVDRETRFTNKFDQFVAATRRVTSFIYNLRLAKKLTVDSFDDLFDYLLQFEKLVNASRAKKLEKSHDPLALVAHTGHYARNCPMPRVRDSKYFMEQMLLEKQDEAGGILTNEQNDFLFADASRMEEIKELSANIYLMARIQPADQNSDDEDQAMRSALTAYFRMSKSIYVASRTGNIEIPLNVRDSEETLEEAFKSQQKMNAKMNNPIAVANKQNSVQDVNKLSVDFELKLQHEKEKQKWDSSKNKNSKPLDFSWISRIQKLEDENVSLDFKVQSLIKERDNAKMEYKKLFDSIKQTRSQTQKEMDELITHVSEKTYAYGAIRAENQNLLVTISELKARLKNGENGKSVNTKFDKTHGSQSFLCVTPLNKNVSQKQKIVLKTKENHVESKPVTSQTSHTKQTGTHQNTNVISPGMYRVVTQQESQTNKSKNVLSSTGMNATSSQTDNTFANVVSNKENVIDVAVANASKAKTLLCVSCMQSVLIPCHDKCVAKHKLNVRSNARRTFSVNSRIPKSSKTTFVAPKTRFSEKATQSKTLDTTPVASKSKIDEASASKARDKVSSEFKKKKRNMRDKPLSPFMLNKIRTSSLWQKWFESQPNVTWTPVNTKTHAHTNPSNTKPLVSVKRWIVKLPVVHVLTFLVLQVVHIVLWVVDSGCSNHMTGDHSLLRNFVEKFMGTVRFGNDNFAAIVFNGKVSIRFMEKCRLCSFIIFCY
ncbi:hypothetical protein Tco_0956199 [Tanacetum coccineum]|uniref:Retrovirus-related Pol polyprotein from transposon TNT 1-94-like beta-barrel domain-containing protein n=1 Tax=Tanacetum coccineum TaxID=301880 RepID=A0ABQ5E9E2_9ASTR